MPLDCAIDNRSYREDKIYWEFPVSVSSFLLQATVILFSAYITNLKGTKTTKKQERTVRRMCKQ